MWSRSSLYVFLFVIIPAAISFKDCSQIDFCNNLRSRPSEDKYTVRAYSFENGSSTVTFTLEPTDNDENGNLQLSFTAIKNSTFRIQIAEVNSARYQLTDVLDGDPELDSIDNIEESQDDAVITIQDTKIIVNYLPFYVQFSRNNDAQILLNGARLVLENTESSQAFAFSAAFPQAARIYGIHEHGERLSLQNTILNGIDPYRFRNVDNPSYAINSPMALYGAIPVLYGHGLTSTSGVFLHNAAQQFIDITNNTDVIEAYIMAESGSLDLFVFLGPTPKDVVSQYLNLTGIPHMPQLWTLGYHQSRWTYLDQEDVKEVIANFDQYNFPVDAIWLDIDYTNGRRYFTWDPETFSDPTEMLANLSSTNRKLVVIIDPHIKVEEGYWVYDGALEGGFFVNNSDGTVFEGDCWPGTSSYLDFLNPATRDYYASMFSYENFVNTTPTLAGIWNDMNEPSIFGDAEEGTMSNDAVHYGGVLHRDIHNIYGFLQTKATHKALIDRDEGLKRPFILTRSHFAGSQRYTGIWTGDTVSDWSYLSVTVPMCLNANILGIYLCGSDVGGFKGDPSEELLQRWYQAGAWLPFYRAHATKETNRREPYLFSDDVQEVLRTAINMRYKHLPQWYTLYFESIRNKAPLIRPLFYQYPNDINAVDIDLEFLVGSNILVRPVVEEGTTSVTIYFPEGESKHWVNYETLSVHNAGDSFDMEVNITTVPVFYKAGSVIVRKDIIRPSSVDMENDGHTLCVVLDEDNTAYGTVYFDDRTSFNYRDNFEYNYLSIEAESETELTSSSQTGMTPTLSLNFYLIDSFAQSENFEFKVDAVEIITFQELPYDGKAGVAKRIRYVRDIYGTLLTDMQLSASKKVIVKF